MTDTNTEIPEETDFENEFNKLAEAKETGAAVEPEEVEPELPPTIENNDGEPGDLPEETPKPDMYAGMNDEAKAFFQGIQEDNEKLNHRIASDDGRVRAYQQQTQELQGKITQLNQAGQAPSKADIVEAMKGGSDGWNKFSEEYPEVAEVIDSRMAAAGAATQESIEQTLAPIQEQQARIAEKEFEAAGEAAARPVTEEFPNWKTDINTEEFTDWKNSQPPGIQNLAQSEQTGDALALLGLYDSSLVANGKQSIRSSTPDNGVETPAGNQQQTDAERLKAKRNRQLSDGTTVQSRGAKIDPGSSSGGDFEESFEFYANKKDRKRA